jgi:hypothetical protein
MTGKDRDAVWDRGSVRCHLLRSESVYEWRWQLPIGSTGMKGVRVRGRLEIVVLAWPFHAVW